ncbi:MAG: creatininase family protein [Phocaeicola sp.]
MEIATTTYGELCHRKIDLVVLPWGATEPHNLHLPYLTDCMLPQAVALEAANHLYKERGYSCAVLPPISLGMQNPGQREYPMCIHTSYATQYAILRDIVISLNHQGSKKLVILNGHGGNSFKSMIRDLLVEYPTFTLVLCDWYAIVPQEGYFEHPDNHAGELETSVMMHYYPHLVDLSKCGSGKSRPFTIESLNDHTAWSPRNWQKTTQDTGVGNPRESTAEKGQRYATKVVERLEKLFVELIEQELYDSVTD